METIHYILDNWDYLLTLTLQHLWLVALAVGLAIVIGVPLGILIVRHNGWQRRCWGLPPLCSPSRQLRFSA